MLNNRHEGYRIPRTVPASLRASFERNHIEYDLNRVRTSSPLAAQKWGARGDEETSTGRKAKFGDTYLSRLGVGGGATGKPSRGTDFSRTRATTEDWEEVRLKKQLAELESKIEKAESQTLRRRANSQYGDRQNEQSRPGLIRRELEQLLDYKRRQLHDLEDGKGHGGAGAKLQEVTAEIETVREQVDGLEKHLRTRQDLLEVLRRETDEEKRSGGR